MKNTIENLDVLKTQRAPLATTNGTQGSAKTQNVTQDNLIYAQNTSIIFTTPVNVQKLVGGESW